MNKEIKEKWLEALRSGRYEQGRQVLRSLENKYCCLGVLCDITMPEAWREHSDAYGIEGRFTCLPNYIIEITGITSFGDLPYEENSLADLNDYGYTFQEIADVIEEQF